MTKRELANMPAYPPNKADLAWGMTYREHVAALVMAGFAAKHGLNVVNRDDSATTAVQWADALIAELAGEGKKDGT